ncbi:hypothetical protein [Oricola sp.]|uniref:hypothetical protein n=1 Tax=Oricola sp. TaxID=1979950 RepID=UPI0025E4818D|nr:hypothetical protein [Oricola sp.]MCI5073423.1 hypothetical protein [Oricola sp.]
MTDALTRATDSILTKMQALNAELRQQDRARFRRIVAEYVNRPDLFLMKSACALRRPSVATVDDAIALHKRAVISQINRKRENHWTFDANRLIANRDLLVIARFIRRYGARIEAGRHREAA